MFIKAEYLYICGSVSYSMSAPSFQRYGDECLRNQVSSVLPTVTGDTELPSFILIAEFLFMPYPPFEK